MEQNVKSLNYEKMFSKTLKKIFKKKSLFSKI